MSAYLGDRMQLFGKNTGRRVHEWLLKREESRYALNRRNKGRSKKRLPEERGKTGLSEKRDSDVRFLGKRVEIDFASAEYPSSSRY